MPRMTLCPTFDVGQLVYLRASGEEAMPGYVIQIRIHQERRMTYAVTWGDGSSSEHYDFELADDLGEMLKELWDDSARMDQANDDREPS